MNRFTLTLLLASGSILCAGAQEVLNIESGTTDISAEKGKSYDRIEMVRTIPEGKYTAFSVPATVDGYYFGVDAPRFLVAKTENGGYDVKRALTDTEDFEPGNVYIVKPAAGWGVNDAAIVIYTAGIKTTVTGTDLATGSDIKVRQAVGSIAKLVDRLNKSTSASEITNGKRDIDELLKMADVK